LPLPHPRSSPYRLAARRRPVTSSVLQAGIARPIAIDMAEIPRLPRHNLQTTASAAHTARRDLPCPRLSQSLMLCPIAPLSCLKPGGAHDSSAISPGIGERNPDCGGVTAGALKKVQVHVLRVSPLSDNPRVRRERSAADLRAPVERSAYGRCAAETAESELAVLTGIVERGDPWPEEPS
jgi:hypothetical protein